MYVFTNKLYVLTILMLSCASSINAQIEYVEGERLSIAHGLSSNGVRAILQDKSGFLWIGTDSGLSRYDGYAFKIYKNDPYDSSSLSNNYIETIYEDRTGRLWIGTQGGLNQFDPYSETFTRYVHDPSVPNSLSANHVSAIYQDKAGSLWIGVQGVSGQAALNKLVPIYSMTQAKVTISPAAKFIRYKLHQDTINSKNNVHVTFIVEDSGSALWIGTNNDGLKKFTPQTGLVVHYRHDPSDPHSIAGNRIRSGIIDHSGFLWIGIWDAGLDRLEPRTGKITHLQHIPSDSGSLPSNNIMALYTEPGGIIWASTGSVLSGYDSQMNLLSRLTISKKPNINYYASDGINVIFQDRSRILWLGTGKNGLIKVNRRPRKFIHYQHNQADPSSLFSNDIQSLYMDNSSKIWITAFGNGIIRFDPDTEKFKHFRYDPADPSSLGHNYVASFCADRLGYIWLGTWAGISRFDPVSETFTHFMKNHPNAKEYKAGSIKHICEDRSGTLWFGTFNGGLYELVPSNLQEKLFGERNEQSTDIFTVNSLPKSVTITEEFDPVLNQPLRFILYKHNPSDSTSISSNAIRGIYEDRRGNLWVTTANGMNLLHRRSRTFRNITREAGFSEYYGPYDRQRFYEDSSGKLWVFSPTLGLCRLDLSKAKSEQFKIVPHALPDDAFMHYDFYETSEADIFGKSEERTIWVSSKYGLHKLDSRTEVFIAHYTQKDGLPGNTAGQIVGDDLGKLWLLSYKGLSVFDESAPSGEQFHHFGAKDGVVNSPYSDHLKGATGDIYWGGANGLYRFFPENLKNNPYIAPIVLTEFQLFNKAVKLDTAITYIKHITLAHNKNSFSFSFAALDYTRPHQNQYAYFMEGFDKDWIYQGNNTTANYTNIPPGDYVFRVKGSNDSGVWNEESASVSITITRPWWRSNWAYAFYIILAILTLYSWRRFDVNRTQLKNELKLKQFEAEKLKELDHLKSHFFANISHEFRTPLTLIIDPLREMITNTFKGNLKEQYGVMLRNSRRLLRLINQLLDLSKLESGMMKLRAGNYELIPFLKTVIFLFESQAARQKIRLRFGSEDGEALDGSPLKLYFDREKLEQIIYNLLSNAFKFTPAGGKVTVQVSFTKHLKLGKAISITVKDTGVGISENLLPFVFDRFCQVDSSEIRQPAPLDSSSPGECHLFDKDCPTGNEGSGIGLALTKELVELHHGEITVISKSGQGTEFAICLPLGRDHLKDDELITEQEVVPAKPKRSITEIEHADKNRTASVPIVTDRKTGTATKSLPEYHRTNLVLVVEDNADLRTYIRQHLLPLYKVEVAKDGSEGVAIALKAIPDLIICDVMMPNMDGFELCRILKKDIKSSHIPIILLTAKASEENKIKGLKIGADDYLIKPFNAKELLVRIKNLINLRQKLQQKYRRDFLLEPTEVTIESIDDKFLRHACEIVEQHISDPEYSVEELSKNTAMSRVNLHRKLRALVNQSASQFIRSVRLKRAVQLLQQHAGNVTEIAFEVGFNSSAYFTKCFKEQFGRLPSEYLRNSS